MDHLAGGLFGLVVLAATFGGTHLCKLYELKKLRESRDNSVSYLKHMKKHNFSEESILAVEVDITVLENRIRCLGGVV